MQTATTSATSLSFSYGRREVLADVSFSLAPGVHGLLGPNGAGKSTLMSVLATVRRPSAGRVAVCGHDLGSAAGVKQARQQLGFLPQRYRLVATMRVLDTVTYAAWTHGLTRSDAHDGAGWALAQVGLSDLASRRVGSLSGGQKQRCAIAAAIAHRPGLLILDEPTVGLDPQARLEFRQLVSRIAQDTTVLLSTHLVEDISRIADHVLVLAKGVVRFDGSVHDLEGIGEASNDPQWADAGPLERAYSELLSRDPR